MHILSRDSLRRVGLLGMASFSFFGSIKNRLYFDPVYLTGPGAHGRMTYTAENMTSYNVMRASNLDYLLVHRSHPVIELLEGTHLLQNQAPVCLDDGRWFKIPKRLFGDMCGRLLCSCG